MLCKHKIPINEILCKDCEIDKLNAALDAKERVGKCHLLAPLGICSTLRCEYCLHFYKD